MFYDLIARTSIERLNDIFKRFSCAAELKNGNSVLQNEKFTDANYFMPSSECEAASEMSKP